MRTFLIVLCLFLTGTVHAKELILQPVRVAENVYAVIGDLGGQTYENDGLNSNLGFVVSDAGVLVINTGPSQRVAQALHTAIKKITSQPVKWAINVNSQNHYWLGNTYFKSLGAVIIAHKEADRIMRETGEVQLDANKTLLKEKIKGTRLTFPSELMDETRELKLGGTIVQLIYFGRAHTPGDMVVWLPQQKIVYGGDIVFTDRMLAVIPIGDSKGWVEAFDKLMQLKPSFVVPGHGRSTAPEKASKDTHDYLVYLRAAAKKAIDQAETLQDTVDNLDQSQFKYLANFDLLAKRNLNRVYLEIEKESF
ncbi:MAG: MBL fold metallo-hydrolase [Gammaproteobacteria bacterium]|nr:MBL fold metallo-hydrolase [Gammaproteobacteria bacterium]